MLAGGIRVANEVLEVFLELQIRICIIHLCLLQLQVGLVHLCKEWTPILTTILLNFFS